ncbi:hypothetical protein HK105_204336 [Polyrhizophydium stewartii]|uniref:Uncharacterized protein n=1 Tax=Polyrhizophydium stewartii TaxID=2732419 RepID=A0ABR4N9P1_9FUNG
MNLGMGSSSTALGFFKVVTANETLSASEIEALKPKNPSVTSYFFHTEYFQADCSAATSSMMFYVRPDCTPVNNGVFLKSKMDGGKIVTSFFTNSVCSGTAFSTSAVAFLPADVPCGTALCQSGVTNSALVVTKLSKAASAESGAVTGVTIAAVAAGVAFF